MMPNSSPDTLEETQANSRASVSTFQSTVDWEAHLEALPLATWICDPEQKGLFLNRACRRLLGVVAPEKMKRQDWERPLHPDDRASYLRAWDRFMNGSAARFKRVVKWRRPDTGQIVQLAVRAQKLSCGQLQGWIRPAHVEQVLAKLEELAYVRR